MEVCAERDIHPNQTDRNKLAYCFTPKHHGGGAKTDGRWHPDLSRPEEFGVFNMADEHQLKDDDGNLYGLLIQQTDHGREIRELGVRHEMIALFWCDPNAPHWHGFPRWRVGDNGPSKRKKQKYCPPKQVFDRIVEEGILTPTEVRRLKTGRHLAKLKGA